MSFIDQNCNGPGWLKSIEDVLKTYDENRHKFHFEEETTVHVWKLDLFVERIRELEAENADLKNKLRDALARC